MDQSMWLLFHFHIKIMFMDLQYFSRLANSFMSNTSPLFLFPVLVDMHRQLNFNLHGYEWKTEFQFAWGTKFE